MLQYTPYILPLVISAIILATLGAYAWQHRTRTAASAFAVVMLASLIWTVGFALEIASVDLQAKLFWANVQFMGIAPLAVAWLTMVIDYTGRTRRLKWLIPVLAIIPLTTNILIWTNDFHHLFRGHPMLDTTSGPFSILVNDYGPWFYWVHAPFGFIIFLASFGLLVRSLLFTTMAYRKQIMILLLSTILPLLVNMLYILGITPIPNFNLTPVAFSVSGIMIGWALFRYRFLDLMPVARSKLIDTMGDALIVLDDAGRFVDLNPAAQSIIGHTSREIIGQPITQVLAHRSDLISRFRANAEAQAEITLGEEETKRYYDLRLSLLHDRRGQITGRFVVLRDITARKQAEEALRLANIQLQETNVLLTTSNADLRAFAHTVAHDLKSPLTMVSGYARLLEEQYAELTSETISASLHAIVKSGARLVRIVDELLLLASVREIGEITAVPLDMSVIVTKVLDRLAHTIEEYQAEITVPETWPQALGYGPWVEEVWVNYIDNALKYGGHPPRVELGALVVPVSTGEMVRFWVRDNGDGLFVEEQARLFIPFTRLEQTRAKGHGLGLSIVRRIVEKLGGQVGVESEGVPGKGSTFFFTLPLQADGAPPNSARSRPRLITAPN